MDTFTLAIASAALIISLIQFLSRNRPFVGMEDIEISGGDDSQFGAKFTNYGSVAARRLRMRLTIDDIVSSWIPDVYRKGTPSISQLQPGETASWDSIPLPTGKAQRKPGDELVWVTITVEFRSQLAFKAGKISWGVYSETSAILIGDVGLTRDQVWPSG